MNLSSLVDVLFFEGGKWVLSFCPQNPLYTDLLLQSGH